MQTGALLYNPLYPTPLRLPGRRKETENEKRTTKKRNTSLTGHTWYQRMTEQKGKK
jgi:hypothetical protein